MMNTWRLPLVDDIADDGAGTEMVSIDLLDAAELAETCHYVNDWLRGAPPAVAASLNAFGGPDAQTMLIETLERLADVLVRAVPSSTPRGVITPTPLTPGEGLGLAELLVDLAAGGFPSEPEPAGWIADDCRRWAVRLLRTR
jgi:hypothetical protein